MLPISEKTNEFAENVHKRLQEANLRCTLDAADDKINAKIKRAHGLKIPYMLVVGPAEAEADSVTVRMRGRKEQPRLKLSDFIAQSQKLIEAHSLELDLPQ